MAKKPRKKQSTESHDEALRSRRRNLKEQLDRIYYTLPYDEVQPVLSELKDTVECLTEMGDTHRWAKGESTELAGHRNRRSRAA